MKDIPVIVLSGFLGSGKTTLLLRILAEAEVRGIRAAVLMNEMGRHDVDGRILEEEMPGIQINRLLDGCICCTQRSEIEGGVTRLLGTSPDLLVMELSGVADPDQIRRALLQPALRSRVHISHILTVIDAERYLEYSSFFSSDRELIHTLRSQVKTAGTVIINKIDTVNDSNLEKIQRAVRKLNPQAEIVPAQHCRIGLAEIWPAEAAPLLSLSTASQQQLGGAATKDPEAPFSPFKMVSPAASPQAASYSSLSSVTLSLPDKSYDREALTQSLAALGSGLVRVKGYVPAGDGNLYLVQGSNERYVWQISSLNVKPYLVFIGRNLEEERLEAAVRAGSQSLLH
ncbi:GTP-binding protein [Paenibacillus sp. J22TS3]|uniref:CobW family GTP-binding protein n=1 Tax=Paenibacillus sp. J22TS3 TaxID=2807192 RepID=UPI001B0B98E8|nr:GTP-binding protein [Paenibacillus sp. J22TS3]GIP23946.1 hypothetical protein J22TS3_42210 [Paenibacillus sp. J22TS3]